jgi:hypothetical protein
MTSEESVPIDLEGIKAGDRRCHELVARGVGRLNRDLAQQRRMQDRRRREHAEREAEHVG